MFQSRCVYEICFRAKRGIPLPSRAVIKFILESAIARTQRGNGKVIICHYTWMANHVHILVVCQDVTALKDFYGELKKRITDMLKRLLGLPELKLWEEREARVMQILDLEKLKRQIGYYYLNPARADQEDSIDRYPGLNTWRTFCSVAAEVDSFEETHSRWIRLPSIPALSSYNPTLKEEERIINLIKGDNQVRTSYKVEPFACFKAFGVTDPQELEAIRAEIIADVRAQEQELREKRQKAGKRVVGALRLIQEPITISGYEPSKQRGRKIYFLSSVLELRVKFCNLYKSFCERCKECYRRACLGDRRVEWPPGAFVPPIPPLANPVGFALGW